MNADELSKSMGYSIKKQRTLLHMSQKALAEGLCSQSMISGIEKGIYIPNAILLASICKKLHLSMDEAVLIDYMEISQFKEFNQKIKRLCEQHEYDKLLNYMNESDMVSKLEYDNDFQVYYYYYACAIYQSTKNYTLAKKHLKMALDYTYISQKANPFISVTELLLLSGLGVIYTEMHDEKNALSYFEIALDYILNNQVKSYNENLNAFFYQFGISLLKLRKINEAIEILNLGITFASDHESHYMMANMFYLLSKCYKENNQTDKYEESYKNYQVLNSIFHDKIFREI